MGAGATFRLLVITPTVVGMVAFWAIQRTSDSTKFLSAWLFGASLLGLWFATLATAMTSIRLTLDGAKLRLEWRRLGRVLRSTEVSVADVVDVALAADPKRSMQPGRRVVIGTRGLDLPLTASYSANRKDQERARAELATFLRVPEGTRDGA
jgi:hypothetical protein